MIKKIAHLADIHIRKTPTRNEEYQQVFDRTIISLKEQKPDRIVIVGDLVHDYLDLQGEQLIMANDFLKQLAGIAPVRITRISRNQYARHCPRSWRPGCSRHLQSLPHQGSDLRGADQ